MPRIFSRFAFAGIFICLATLVLASPLRAQSDAARTYKTNCVLCHSANGSGNSAAGKAMGAKDLRSEEVQKKPDAELAEIITKGSGKMPAFGSKLSTDVTRSLVAYIREMAKAKK